jgi:hypothetical protein
VGVPGDRTKWTALLNVESLDGELCPSGHCSHGHRCEGEVVGFPNPPE